MMLELFSTLENHEIAATCFQDPEIYWSTTDINEIIFQDPENQVCVMIERVRSQQTQV